MSLLDKALEPATQWLNTLQPREKFIVIYGGIALLFILFYLLIWSPITEQLEYQKQKYVSQQQLHSWMKNAAHEIASIKSSSGGSAVKFRNQSITSLADRSARTTGVKAFINKIEQSKDDVKVTLKSANFDLIINWLADLQDKYGITSSSVKIEQTGESGSIDAYITLQRL